MCSESYFSHFFFPFLAEHREWLLWFPPIKLIVWNLLKYVFWVREYTDQIIIPNGPSCSIMLQEPFLLIVGFGVLFVASVFLWVYAVVAQ